MRHTEYETIQAMTLVEVKTSDRFLESQLRFARGIGSPYGL
jgi:hypothetical protein